MPTFENVTKVPQGFRSIAEKFDSKCIMIAPGETIIIEEENADAAALRRVPAFKEVKD